MSNKILFVFEGEKTEKQIADSLTKHFLDPHTIITCAYCTTVYPIYREIVADDDLDIFSLLKAMPKNAVILKDFSRDDFAEIYLFFDYDGHAPGADDTKIDELLKFFNEETDKGKLYISYPMVESLKHIKDYTDFKDVKVACKTNVRYKGMVAQNCLEGLVNLTLYCLSIWKRLIGTHLMKMNYIVSGKYLLPTDLVLQLQIFDAQLQGYILVDGTVGVLSAFPVFLHDYYGNKKLLELIA